MKDLIVFRESFEVQALNPFWIVFDRQICLNLRHSGLVFLCL